MPISERPLAFIDTETTGLDSAIHEVIEVAIVKEYPDGRIEYYQSLIRPERIEDAHPKALEVNGYAADPSRWDRMETMETVGPLILSTLKDCVVVGHNVGFDIDMLEANMRRAGLSPRLPYHKIDTVTLAYEHLVPCGLESLSLDNIRRFLDWSLEDAHTAMKDAKDARRLYRLCNRSGKVARFLMRWGHRRRTYKATQ
jgi:DNA polymerase-3 subunit epsilon